VLLPVAKRTPSAVPCLRLPSSRAADSAPRRRGWRSAHRLLLTACSRRDDTHGYLTTPDDTGRHVAAGSVPGRSNLRIRCPKGRGSSTLPSRTPFDLRIFVPRLWTSWPRSPSCSRLLTERAAAAHEAPLVGPAGGRTFTLCRGGRSGTTRREGAQHLHRRVLLRVTPSGWRRLLVRFGRRPGKPADPRGVPSRMAIGNEQPDGASGMHRSPGSCPWSTFTGRCGGVRQDRNPYGLAVRGEQLRQGEVRVAGNEMDETSARLGRPVTPERVAFKPQV